MEPLKEDDWPFLHLNLISPNQPSQQRLSTGLDSAQDLLPLPFDSDQLEAWSNVHFNFDDQVTPAPRFVHIANQTSPTPTNSCGLSDPFPSTLGDPFCLLSSTPSDPQNRFLNPITPVLPSILEASIPEVFENPTQGLTSHAKKSIESTKSSSNPVHPNPHGVSSAGRGNQYKSHTGHHTSQVEENQWVHSQKSEHSSNGDDDEAYRAAHEDDKRRRNTLASARFRMKKKMKEQEIERTAKEMKERVGELEKEVETLKQENKWLRSLIVDQAASKTARLESDPITCKRKINLESIDVQIEGPTKKSKIDNS